MDGKHTGPKIDRVMPFEKSWETTFPQSGMDDISPRDFSLIAHNKNIPYVDQEINLPVTMHIPYSERSQSAMNSVTSKYSEIKFDDAQLSAYTLEYVNVNKGKVTLNWLNAYLSSNYMVQHYVIAKEWEKVFIQDTYWWQSRVVAEWWNMQEARLDLLEKPTEYAEKANEFLPEDQQYEISWLL